MRILAISCITALAASWLPTAATQPAPNAPATADKYPKDRDYAKELRELIRSRRANSSYKPGEEATDLWQALAVLAAERSGIFQFGVQRSASLLRWAKTLHTDESHVDPWYDACLALEGKHDVTPVLEEIRAICRTIDGLSRASLLDAANGKHVIMPPIDGLSPLLANKKSLHDPLRSMARLNRLRMLLAIHDGDAPGFLLIAEETLLAADIVEHDPCVLSRLIAHAIRNILWFIARDELASGRLTAEMRAGMIRLLCEPERESWYHTVQGERLIVLDALNVAIADTSVAARLSGHGDDQTRMKAIIAKMEPREACLAHADLLFDLLEQAGSRSPEARDAYRKFDELSLRLAANDGDGSRFPHLSVLMPSFNRVFNIEQQSRTLRRAVATLLAIEAFRGVHGKLPESLGDLVPQFLPAIPKDAFTFERDDLRYRRVDPASDPSGRSFLLYSVGGDREDHGGKEDPKNPDRGASHLKSDAGFDLILNAPSRKPPADR